MDRLTVHYYKSQIIGLQNHKFGIQFLQDNRRDNYFYWITLRSAQKVTCLEDFILFQQPCLSCSISSQNPSTVCCRSIVLCWQRQYLKERPIQAPIWFPSNLKRLYMALVAAELIRQLKNENRSGKAQSWGICTSQGHGFWVFEPRYIQKHQGNKYIDSFCKVKISARWHSCTAMCYCLCDVILSSMFTGRKSTTNRDVPC